MKEVDKKRHLEDCLFFIRFIRLNGRICKIFLFLTTRKCFEFNYSTSSNKISKIP